MAEGYTVEFGSLDKGALIEIKRHLRTYQRTRLHSEDAVAPKVWGEKRSITCPGWSYGEVVDALRFAIARLGPGVKAKPIIRPSGEADLRHAEEDMTSGGETPVTLTQPVGLGVGGGHPTAKELESIPTRTSAYGLLVTRGVWDALSTVEGSKRDIVSAFLRGLAEETWTQLGGEIVAWSDGGTNRVLFTADVPGLGVPIWERVQSVDLLGSIADPPKAYADGSPRPPRISPHVAIYEVRTPEATSGPSLSFEGHFFKRNDSQQPLAPLEPADHDQVSFSGELFNLSRSRVRDLVDGKDVELPLHLSEDQVRALLSSGPILLGGEAGSGKSSVIVLWLLVNHLQAARQRDRKEPLRQLFVTYSPRLRDKARQDFELLLPDGNKNHATDFKTFKDVLSDIATLAGVESKFPPGSEMNFERFVREVGPSASRAVDPVLLWDEIRSTIKGGLSDSPSPFIDFPTYQGLSEKKGRTKTPQDLRAPYYDQAQKYQEYLLRNGLWDQLDLVGACLKAVSPGRLQLDYARIACDEVQDLAPLEIHLLTQMLSAERQIENLFLTGDEAQVINPSGFRWSRLKGDLGEIARPLRIPEVLIFHRNFRNSREIVALVNSVLQVRKELLDDEASGLTQIANARSEAVPIVLRDSPLELLRNVETNPDARLVLVKTPGQKAELQKALGESQKAVSVLTVEEAKGLEWDGVLLYNFFVPRNDMLTGNEWESVFVPHKRALITKSIASGTTNPYGLTYEFNLLHVGLTRSRRVLAIYDSHPQLKIENLGGPVSASLSHGDLEAFNIQWQTQVPKAEDYRRLAEKLAERDSVQARTFYQLAAEKYREFQAFATAADCYERALRYLDGAQCYAEVGDTPNELRLKAKDKEIRKDFAGAGELQTARGSDLVELNQGELASDAYWEAYRLFGLAGLPDRQVDAAIKRAESLPANRNADRSLRFVEAARTACEVAPSTCSELHRRALHELEGGGRPRYQTIGGETEPAWRAASHFHISEHLSKQGDWKGAASEAQKASGLYRSAADRENFSQRTVYSERADASAAACVDYAIYGEEFANAHSVRQDLFETRLHHGSIETTKAWWTTWMARYLQKLDFDEYSACVIELSSVMSDRRDFQAAISILRESAAECSRGNARRPRARILNEAIRLTSMAGERRAQGDFYLDRAQMYEGEGERERASDDYKNAGIRFLEIGELERCRAAFRSAVTCAEAYLKPTAVGRLCLKDIGIEQFGKANLSRDLADWSELASEHFAEAAEAGVLELETLTRQADDTETDARSRTGRKDEVEREIRSAQRTRAWVDVCSAITLNRISKRGLGRDFAQRGRTAIESARAAFGQLGDLDALNELDKRGWSGQRL